jgi:hypothetical protein
VEQTVALLVLIALSCLIWWGWQVLRRRRPLMPRRPSLPRLGRRDAAPPPAAEHPTVELPLAIQEPAAESPPTAGEPMVDEDVEPAAVTTGWDVPVSKPDRSVPQNRPDVLTGPSPDDYPPPTPPTTATSARNLPNVEPDPAPVDVLRTWVVSEHGAVTVRLVGARTPSGPALQGWFHGVRPPEGSPTLVTLGANETGTLYFDLALAPDVVTVTGSPESRQRQALSLVRQLIEAGVAVTAVGSPFGASHPLGCPRVATVEDAIDDAAGANDEWRVLFYAPADDRDTDGNLAAIRRALSIPRPQLVPVLVGDVRPGRWSLDVQDLDARDAGAHPDAVAAGAPSQATPAGGNGAGGARRRL